MWFKNHMKSKNAWWLVCMQRNVHSYIMFTVHIVYISMRVYQPQSISDFLLQYVLWSLHASQVPSSSSLIVLPRWWKIRFRSTSGRSNAWSNDRNVQRSLRCKQLGCVSDRDYPVILRILGFFSSSFCGKIHHPRLRSSQNITGELMSTIQSIQGSLTVYMSAERRQHKTLGWNIKSCGLRPG